MKDYREQLPSNREVAGFWFGFLASTFGLWLLVGIPLIVLAWWLW